MASIRSLGLALCAAIVAAVLVGAATSSATVLCSVEMEVCAEAQTLPAKTAFSASLASGTSAVFNSGLGKVQCKVSTLKGTTSAKEAEPLGGELSALEFSECVMGETKCALAVTNLPFSASFAYSKAAEMEGHGTLTLGNSGKGPPTVTSTCGGIKCAYTATPSLEIGGEPTWAVAAGAALVEGKGLFCPKEASFSVTYQLSTPESGHLYTARAQVASTKLCKVQPELEGGVLTCPAGEGYSGTILGGLTPTGEGRFIGPAGVGNILCSEVGLTGKFQESGASATGGGIESLIYRTGGGDCTSTIGGAKVQVAMVGLGYDKSRIVAFQPEPPEAALGIRGATDARLRIVIGEKSVCEYRRGRLAGLIQNGVEGGGVPTTLEIDAVWNLRLLEPIECPAFFVQAGIFNRLILERPGALDIFVAQG